MTRKPWRVTLGVEAETDFMRILAYTLEIFGPRQTESYEAAILEALAALNDGPEVVGSRSREDLRPGLRSLHVARGGGRGRHVIFYRTKGERHIQIVRILHDAMDFARHMPF